MAKYFDEFKNLKLESMSQKISDMTYNFNETRVPKEHYKKLLNQEIIDLISNEPSIEINLLEPYLNMIGKLQKENMKYFFKALLLLDLKIPASKVDTVTFEALELAWNIFKENKLKFMNEEIINFTTEYIKNGLPEKEENNNMIS